MSAVRTCTRDGSWRQLQWLEGLKLELYELHVTRAGAQYLAITLARLEDFDNSCSAYEKAIEMESDHLFELNYAVSHQASETYSNPDDAESRCRRSRCATTASTRRRRRTSWHSSEFSRCALRPHTPGGAACPRPRPVGQELDSETKNADPEVLEQRQTLSHLLLLDAPANDTSDDTGDK